MHTYSLLHSYRGAVRHHKPGYIPHSHSYLRAKHKSQPKDIHVERVLIIIQCPVANDNITQLLNSHPDVVISHNLNFLDLVANFTSKELWESVSTRGGVLLSDSVLKKSQMSAQSTSDKKIKVVGFSSVVTTRQMETLLRHRHLQACLKKLSNLRLPVSVLFVNTSSQKHSDTSSRTAVDVQNALANVAKMTPVLCVEQHHLSTHSFLTKVCTFLRLNCPQDYLDSVTTKYHHL